MTADEYADNDENRHINTFNRFHNVLMMNCRDFYNYTYACRRFALEHFGRI